MANETAHARYRDYDAYERGSPSATQPPRAPAEDPLAELARIIGQDDMYAEYLKRGARSEPALVDEAPATAPDEIYDIPAMPLRAMDSVEDADAADPAEAIDWEDLEAELARFTPEASPGQDVGEHAGDDGDGAPGDAWDAFEREVEEERAHPGASADASADNLTGSDSGERWSFDEADLREALDAASPVPRPADEAATEADNDRSSSGLGVAAAAGAVAAGAAVAGWRLRKSSEQVAAHAPSMPAAVRADNDPVYTADGHMPPHPAGLSEEEAQPRRRRSGMAAVVAVVGLAAVGATGVLGYRALTGGTSSGTEARVVRANSEPVRVPVQQAQDSKPITDRAPVGGDRVVSREERPLNPREQSAQVQQPPAPRVIPLSPQPADAGVPPVAMVRPVAPSAPAAVADPASTPAGVASPRPAGQAEEPRRVRTVPVGPDGQPMGQRATPGGLPLSVSPVAPRSNERPVSIQASPATTAAPTPSAAPSQTSVVPTPPPAPARPIVTSAAPQREAAPTRPAPQRSAVQAEEEAPTRPARRQQEPRPLDIAPQRTASVRPAAPATGGGGSFVQISSHTTESEARSAFSTAQRRYSMLQGYSPNIRAVDLGDRGTWHRLRVGPFSRSEAQGFCERLRAAGGSCVIN